MVRRALLAALTASLVACVADQDSSIAANPMLGDPMRGREYAEAVCAECHAAEAGVMESPNLNAPSFAELAATPGVTSTAINVWLQTPHQDMPNLIIPQDRIDDLSAYILSLRAGAPRT